MLLQESLGESIINHTLNSHVHILLSELPLATEFHDKNPHMQATYIINGNM